MGLAQPFVGMLGDRHGARPVLVGCALVYAAGLALMAWGGPILGLDVGCGLLVGIGIAGCGFGVVLGAVSRAVPPERRVPTVGLVSAAGSVATLFIAPVGPARLRAALASIVCCLTSSARAVCSASTPCCSGPLTDAFIITLATANTLNQHLGRDLGSGAAGDASLAELGAAALRQLARPDREPFWLLRMFARHGGALAKACESLDHLEDYPFRNAMRESNLNLFKLVVGEAVARRINLDDRYRERLRQVEGRVIFDEIWRRDRPATA